MGLVWLVALAAAIGVLYACASILPGPPWPSGESVLSDWLQQRGPIGAAFSIVRLVALAIAWYLVAVTALALLARLSGSRPLARFSLRLTPRLFRAALRPLLGAGLSVSLLGATAPLLMGASVAHATPASMPASASAAPGVVMAGAVVRTDLGVGGAAPADLPPPTIVVTPLGDPPVPPTDVPSDPPAVPGSTTADHVDEAPPPTVVPPSSTTTTLPPPRRMSPASGVDETPPSEPAPSETPPSETPPADPPAPDLASAGTVLTDLGSVVPGPLARSLTEPDHWIIAPGDHLWHVAETSLRQSWGRPGDDAEIEPYWEALIAANRDRLADPDNPDLVLPGQELVLPPRPAG